MLNAYYVLSCMFLYAQSVFVFVWANFVMVPFNVSQSCLQYFFFEQLFNSYSKLDWFIVQNLPPDICICKACKRIPWVFEYAYLLVEFHTDSICLLQEDGVTPEIVLEHSQEKQAYKWQVIIKFSLYWYIYFIHIATVYCRPCQKSITFFLLSIQWNSLIRNPL